MWLACTVTQRVAHVDYISPRSTDINRDPSRQDGVSIGHSRDRNVFNKELQRWEPQIGGLSHCQGSEQDWSLDSL